jgi:hypothetical protein
VALPSQVFHLQYVARAKHPFCTAPYPNFHLAGEDDDVLNAWSIVPIAKAPVRETPVRHIGTCL